jgi:hypothetical protein
MMLPIRAPAVWGRTRRETPDDLFTKSARQKRESNYGQPFNGGAYHGILPVRNGAPNMTLDDFRSSLTATEPPAGLTSALTGLWWHAKGDWKRAHESAQRDEGPEGSWVHAYLHRKEGDQGNAGILVQPGRQANLS